MDHLEAAAKQLRGQRPEGLDGPPCPPALEYLWGWFLALSNRRSGSGFGAAPITWLDLDAWKRANRIVLSPYEQDCLAALDTAYLKSQEKPGKP